MTKLENIKRSFDISRAEVRKIIKDFHAEMEKGLAGKSSSLKMIPTYVDRPTGNEKGKFLALDLGGTNFRILKLKLMGKGRVGASKVKKFLLDKKRITGSGDSLFDFIARCIKSFLKENSLGKEERLDLGFTFSFPVEQTGIAAGRLLRWTKGFDAKGVLGNDVVRLLSAALERKGVRNIKVTALLNDTVGTLAAGSYVDSSCDVGVIIGTGTNACYREELSRIVKWNGPRAHTGYMIINIEWGNFNRLKRTLYDRRLDKSSENPGEQILEKMVSGMYSGKLSRLIIKDLIKMKIENFLAEDMSKIEKDNSRGLSRTKVALKKLGVSNSTLEERTAIRKVCEIVSERASRVSASAIAAVVTKMDPDLSRNHTVAIDGSVYEKHPGFSENMKAALREIFGRKSSRIKLVLAKDGSGKGAAIIAAVAASRNEIFYSF